jgi:predicted DsbA family dithiol-disulfide isomerase|tara:strand:+ start:5139 stop:5390 length:252 start_codon:yes stop_codon:yes gene_type:complete
MKGKSISASTPTPTSLMLYKAAMSHFESQKNESLAILKVYFQSSLGVGDHPNFLDEIKKAAISLSEAEEALLSLEKYKNDILS